MKPFCLILTHRHGACVGIVLTIPPLIQSDEMDTLQKYCAEKSTLVQSQENFEFISDKKSFIFSRALGKTAENLTNLFQFSCDSLTLCKQDIENLDLILGAGPGSFTGLRLGCAFANGLHFGSGSKQNLCSVGTQLITDISNKLDAYSKIKETFLDELGTYNTTDPASGYVTFFDLFCTIHEILKNNITRCGHFMPNYGKEPAPVLNLRKE